MSTAATITEKVTKELAPADLEREVISWTESCYSEADDELMRQHETKLTGRVIDFIEGKQWGARQRSGRSRPVINRTVQKFIEMCGLLTDLEMDFQVSFPDKIDGYSELEKLFNRMIVDWAEAPYTDFEQELSQVVMFGLIHSGFVKIQWNPWLNGGIGDVEFQPISPLNFMMVGTSDKVQNAEVCIARRVVTLPWLIRRYGEVAKYVQPDARFSEFGGETVKPARFTKSSWAGLSKPLQNLLGTKQEGIKSKFPRVMLKEFWLRDDKVNERSETIIVGNPLCNWSYKVEPGMPLYPRGRVIMTAGGKVLEDTCNPYWHAQFPFAMYRAFRVPWKLQGLCYSSDTEVLTKRGWLLFSDTNESDEFATREIGTGKFEWQKATARTEEPYSGDMYRFSSRSMDMVVTPEHRMLVTQLPRALGGSTARHGEAVVTAQNLARYGNHHTQIPQTSVWEGVEIGEKAFSGDVEARTKAMVAKAKRVGRTGMTPKQAAILAAQMGKRLTMTGDDYCAFMGMFLAEGWTSKNTVHISQHAESKGYEPFKLLLEKIVGTSVKHDGKDFILHRTALRNHVREFGVYSYDKFIPEEILNATPRQLRIFWDHYMLGDGQYLPRPSVSGRGKQERFTQTITTVSKNMAGQLVEVAQKMGYSASVYTRPAMKDVPLFSPGRICQVREAYIVRLRYSQAMAVQSDKFQYDGTIHCVTVPNGFLYVRRNGKPSWSGNSIMEPIVAMQSILNRINGGVMDTVAVAVERPLIGPKASLSQGDWDSVSPNDPGAKIAYNNNAPREPKFMDPPILPQYVDAFSRKVEQEMDSTSGASAISQAIAKKQVPGGDALDMIFNSRSTNIRFMGRSLKSFLRDSGGLVCSTMMQFYDASRRIEKYGVAGIVPQDMVPFYGHALPKGMEPEEFVRKACFNIRKGSLLAIERSEELPIAFGLRKAGDLSRNMLFRFIDRNIDVNLNNQELNQEMAEKAAIAAAAGALAPKGHKK